MPVRVAGSSSLEQRTWTSNNLRLYLYVLLVVPQYVNPSPFIFQQLQATAMPWCPAYQGIPVAGQNHYPSQYQAPSRRFHQAGYQYVQHARILWNVRRRLFHRHRSRLCLDQRQRRSGSWEGMENPAKESINCWSQLNPADITIPPISLFLPESAGTRRSEDLRIRGTHSY